MKITRQGVYSFWAGACAITLAFGAGATGTDNRVNLKAPTEAPGLADTNFALEPPAFAHPDALLALDLNRSAVVNKILAKFATEQPAERLALPGAGVGAHPRPPRVVPPDGGGR